MDGFLKVAARLQIPYTQGTSRGRRYADAANMFKKLPSHLLGVALY